MTKTIHVGIQYFKDYDATDVRFSRIYLRNTRYNPDLLQKYNSNHLTFNNVSLRHKISIAKSNYKFHTYMQKRLVNFPLTYLRIIVEFNHPSVSARSSFSVTYSPCLTPPRVMRVSALPQSLVDKNTERGGTPY